MAKCGKIWQNRQVTDKNITRHRKDANYLTFITFLL